MIVKIDFIESMKVTFVSEWWLEKTNKRGSPHIINK